MTVSVLASRKCENRDFGTERAIRNSCATSRHFRLGHKEFYGKIFFVTVLSGCIADDNSCSWRVFGGIAFTTTVLRLPNDRDLPK